MTENKSKYLCDIKRNIIDLLRDMNYTGARIVIDASVPMKNVDIRLEETQETEEFIIIKRRKLN